ncbi:MAG: BolA family transcriptional regulator [Mangrovicoccus sp.]|nr:BolA family transcriptional regulator [Mangrovicoccus sp.]
MRVAEQIRQSLEDAFHPTVLEIQDDSEAHRGHSGYSEGEESHFNVKIRAAAFADMNRLARHRAVHGALGPELVGSIHALALDIDV